MEEAKSGSLAGTTRLERASTKRLAQARVVGGKFEFPGQRSESWATPPDKGVTVHPTTMLARRGTLLAHRAAAGVALRFPFTCPPRLLWTATAVGASCSRPLSAAAVATPTPPSAAPLPWKPSSHSGVVIDVAAALSTMPLSQFATQLTESLSAWHAEGRKAVWLTVDIKEGDVMGVASAAGFEFHHACGTSATLVKWVSDEDNRVPVFATHQVGVGGVVVDDDNNVLMIQERAGISVGHWKFPGGLSNAGEDIGDSVVREVFEETGVRTEFQVGMQAQRGGVRGSLHLCPVSSVTCAAASSFFPPFCRACCSFDNNIRCRSASPTCTLTAACGTGGVRVSPPVS